MDRNPKPSLFDIKSLINIKIEEIERNNEKFMKRHIEILELIERAKSRKNLNTVQ